MSGLRTVAGHVTATFFTLALAFSISVEAAELKVIEVATPHIGSKLFVPNDGKPHPGVLLLHGSEGGSFPYYWAEAQIIAAHGYSVLAFCWYHCAKDPITAPMDTIEDIDLNKTADAYTWLKNSSHVDKKKTAIVGTSRGAEQALILGWKMAVDTKDLPAAIAVHAPSDVVVTGFSWAAMDKRCWICKTLDDTCFKGAKDPRGWDWSQMVWNPSCGEELKDPTKDPMTAWSWNKKPVPTDARIEIEHFKNPVFLTHGTIDEWWDHTRTLNIEKTLKDAGATPEVHIFKGESHVFKTVAENERKELLLKFLKTALAP
jgi:dienelactone hydrolase